LTGGSNLNEVLPPLLVVVAHELKAKAAPARIRADRDRK
jgi:hypothetical protein